MDSALTTCSIFAKLENLQRSLAGALNGEDLSVPPDIARDITVAKMSELPSKPGLSTTEGQARLLHDLASIELQAMELGLRTLLEFKHAPEEFRQQLHDVTLEESEHLRLCLSGIDELGYKWGDWPTHTALWNAVSHGDSLLDRILIVHRYLEGSGLDAGETILRRLHGIEPSCTHQILNKIVHDEVAHVDFGSRWYRLVCAFEKIDPEKDFMLRMQKLKTQLPKRMEKISHKLRLQSGFTMSEIQVLENFRTGRLNEASV